MSSAIEALNAAAGRPRAGGGLEVRPDGVVPLRRAGRAPQRVLLYGGGAMVGWGLLDHDRGLPGLIADRMVGAGAGGVDLDVIVEQDPTRSESLALLRSLRIARYDAVVVLLGERAALDGTARRSWAQEFGSLAQVLEAETRPGEPVFVFDSAQPMLAVSSSGLRRRRAMADASRLAGVSRTVAEGRVFSFEELSAPRETLGWGRQLATADLRLWAERIARAVVPAVRATSGEAVAAREGVQDEWSRQRAVEGLHLHGQGRDGLLDGIVRQAKVHYRVADAFLSIVDGDRVWQRASAGSVLHAMPRATAMCGLTVQSDLPTIINDLAADPRIEGDVEMNGRPVAFYAGEPIRSADGYRVGALCIMDGAPRSMRPEQAGELHVLAGRIEKELWTRSLGPR